jgi:hypothetical protein
VVALAVSKGGSVSVIVVDVAVHPLASVTVKVYEPGPREYVPVPVYGDVPPVAETVIVEVPPLQGIGGASTMMASCVGSVSVITDEDALQPLASVTVKVWLPAPRTKLPVPLYGGVPPLALTVTVVVPPWHAIGAAVALTASNDGSLSVTGAEVALQPFASLTVNVYVPAP